MDLSLTNPLLTIPSAGGLTVASGASVNSSAGGMLISLANTVPYASPLTQGLYGTTAYSVMIAGGLNRIAFDYTDDIDNACRVGGR